MIQPEIRHIARQTSSAEAFATQYDPDFGEHRYEELDGFIAIQDGLIVGTILTFSIDHPSLSNPVCRIVALAVTPEWEAAGLSERLVHAVEDHHGHGTFVYGAFDGPHSEVFGRMGYVVGRADSPLRMPGTSIEVTPTAKQPHMVSHLT
ncbi:GNAT family N-acetyltransferase [Spongisporangium articulatum]|uniref:GNAT family N-acetyltransferase n=1 Tax=Spongisporangium articulatum TaxID=3362603 RepID=A0ABW8ARP2_9ACTN